MDAQALVNRFAALAQTRLATLLRLKDAVLIYEPEPGALNSKFVAGSIEVTLDKWKTAAQPYRDIERFVADDRVMQFIIEPGLLPIAKAMSKDILGKKLLVTRKIAGKKSDHGVIAHVDGFGVRIIISFDDESGDTILTWECLYGVA